MRHLPVCQGDNSIWVVNIVPNTLIRSWPISEENKLPITVRVEDVIDYYRPTQSVAVLGDLGGISQSQVWSYAVTHDDGNGTRRYLPVPGL